MYCHWRTDDETAVILQSRDGQDSRAVRLFWRHTKTRFYLRPYRKIGQNHVGRNRNRGESHFSGSFGSVTKAAAKIWSASAQRITTTSVWQIESNTNRWKSQTNSASFYLTASRLIIGVSFDSSVSWPSLRLNAMLLSRCVLSISGLSQHKHMRYLYKHLTATATSDSTAKAHNKLISTAILIFLHPKGNRKYIMKYKTSQCGAEWPTP